MRAKGTLVLVFALFGAAASMSVAEAAERNQRQTQKQVRPSAAAPAPAARQAAKPVAHGTRQTAAAPAAARTQPTAAQRQAAQRQTGQRHAGQRQGPTRAAFAIPPQEEARAHAAMPAVFRSAAAQGHGTPILPVSISSGLSCVPFARMATGMNISGDARMWWYNAAGAYARGQRPERGSILAFTASGGMSRGHVAVVSRVINGRTIAIDHANWGGPGIRRGQVMRDVIVVDVSDRNDWTAVRVQVGWDNDTFGRTYTTHGFIYNRPDSGVIMVRGRAMQEVAEAPSPHAAQHMRLTAQLFGQ